MARLSNITDYQKKKALQKAEALPENIPQKIEEPTTLQDPAVTQGFQQMGQMNPQQPVLKNVTPVDVYNSTRQQAIGATSEADAEKGMEYWNASPKEYWTEKMRQDPNNSYYYARQMLASDETPEEKRKRERREQLGEVFSGLGNLIGNAANLYYTHRGGQYIDLNTANEKHRDRMQRIKDKQDALAEQTKNIILNAKLGDIKADRAEKLAMDKLKAEQAIKDKDNAFKLKFNAYMKELDNAYKMGQIDAQTAANLKRDAEKAKTDKELEAIKQQNRITLKTTPSYGENKVVDSAIGADGNIYTRNSRLTDNEAMQIVLSSVPEDEFSQFVTTDENGRERTDWRAAAAYALQKGYVAEDELEQMGFKRGKTSKKKDGNSLGIGIGNNNNNGNKLGIGL